MAQLEDTLRRDLTAAMKRRDELVTATLRMAIAAVQNASVAGKEQVELDDGAVVDVLRREIKRRRDAAGIYEDAGRTDRGARERAEAAVLEGYLPAAMDADALAAVVAEEVATARAAGLEGGKAMGAVIKAVRSRVGDGADGGTVAAAVKAALGA